MNNKYIKFKINNKISIEEYKNLFQGIDNEVYLIIYILEQFKLENNLNNDNINDIINNTNIIDHIILNYEWLHLHGINDIMEDINENMEVLNARLE